MSSIMYVSSGTAMRAARAGRGTEECGAYADAPHIVFQGGWYCAICGYDTRPKGEGYKFGPIPYCQCGDPSGYAMWGSYLYCMTCNCDVDPRKADKAAEFAMAADPEWLDVPTPSVRP